MVCCSISIIHVNGHRSNTFCYIYGDFYSSGVVRLDQFIPGGFGTFDLVVLLGLKALNVSEEAIVLGLSLYRFAYYLFPVLIALILSTFEFRSTAKRYWEDSRILVPVKDIGSYQRT